MNQLTMIATKLRTDVSKLTDRALVSAVAPVAAPADKPVTVARGDAAIALAVGKVDDTPPESPSKPMIAAASAETVSGAAERPEGIVPEVQAAHGMPPADRMPTPLLVPKPMSKPTPTPVPTPTAKSWRSFDFEMLLGTRVLARVGMLMVIIAAAYFLRYAYDQQWIGPLGRTLIGVLIGMAALAGGEYFRRQRADVLFQTLTGGAIGVFYVCVYFAFHVYQFAGAGASFGCAALITLFAIAMAVLHNSMPIAILGQIGGFLSPILLSTGGNHPYALFSYVAVLDLTAFGAAFFRRWRFLDLLSFAGTLFLYQGWYAHYHDADQMVPALLFTTLFYLMFLAIPSVYGLVRKSEEGYQGLTLIAGNAMQALGGYYQVLYADYPQAMGCVVLGQALLMYLLFQAWSRRVGGGSYTAQTLLILCLALVTLAIPIQLRLYAIPVAWAAEAVVLTWMASRYQRLVVRIGGSAALALAVLGLLEHLPLHAAPFLPVLNPAFASWLWVAAAAALVSWLQRRHIRAAGDPLEPAAYATWAVCAFVASYALAYGLFTMETCAYWQLSSNPFADLHMSDSLLAVWSTVLLLTGGYVFTRGRFAWLPHMIWITLPPAGAFLLGLDRTFRYDSAWLFLNTPFVARAYFVLVLFGFWRGLARRNSERLDPVLSASQVFTLTRREGLILATVVEMVAHGALTLLLAVEFTRWGRHSELVSGRMTFGMISAAWALQAFFLIWHGLWSKEKTPACRRPRSFRADPGESATFRYCRPREGVPNRRVGR